MVVFAAEAGAVVVLAMVRISASSETQAKVHAQALGMRWPD